MRKSQRGRWAVVCLMGAWACGGGSSNPGAPSSPPPGQAATTISIVGERGAQSFTPNPASASQGQTVSWRNNDAQIHRIVFNDGSLDTGDIAPGAASSPRAMPTNGTRYHCSIHPEMVGGINQSSGTPPPCQGPYCEDD
jgi:plastocyanin